MALTYNLEGIADYESTCFRETDEGRTLRPKTEALTLITMAIGMGDITDDTLTEFTIRCRMWEQAIGVICYDGKGKLDPITTEDVKAHLGLTTNASRMSKAQFHSNLVRVLRHDLTY